MTLLPSALEWVCRGYPVLPLHMVDASGRCSCGRRCSHEGKHPRIDGGPDFGAATTDEVLIRKWWETWPEANVGIPTGQRTDLFVVDLDTEGDRWQQVDFVTSHGIDEAAVIVRTGSGGKHYWFARPDVPGRLSHGGSDLPFGVQGIHVRCDGGYIVVPPSSNAHGPYSLLEAYFDELAPPHPDLVQMLLALRQRKRVVPGAPILKGTRDNTLTSLAGTMRRVGMTETEIVAALLVANEERCRPPLDEAQVRKVAASVASYEPEHRTGRFATVPADLLLDSSLSPQAKLAYGVLALHTDWRGPTAGHTSVGVATVAEETGASEDSLTRWFRELSKARWMTRSRRGARRTSETVLHKEPSQKDGEAR